VTVLVGVSLLTGETLLPRRLLVALTLGLAPIFIASLIDDIRPLGPWTRLGAQVAGASIAVSGGFSLHEQIHLFGVAVPLGWLAIPLSMLWLVSITNAFNLVDGLDGLSAGLALISAVSLMVIAAASRSVATVTVSVAMVGALVGFLPYNRYPARVFLGDCGATALGFCLGCLALTEGARLSSGMAVLVPLLVTGLPIAETFTSMLRRALGRWQRINNSAGVLRPDMEHMHHRLLQLGLDQPRAVMLLWGAGFLMAAVGVGSLFVTHSTAAILLATLIVATGTAIARLGYDEFGVVRRGVALRFYEVPVLRLEIFRVFVDLAFVALAIYGAIVLKHDDWGIISHRVLAFELATVLPVTAVVIFSASNVYRSSWRHASLEDIARAGAAALTSVVVGFALCRLVFGAEVSPTLMVTYALVLLLLVTGSRSSFKLLADLRRPSPGRSRRVGIYGAGVCGSMALRELHSSPSMAIQPVLFIDDDPRKLGKLVNGKRVVGGLGVLEAVIVRERLQGLIVASRLIPEDRVSEALEVCDRHGITLMRFQVDVAPLKRHPTLGIPERRRLQMSH
jgi:UDP-GlcNAc:undecaprenyl-phosphate GlcNAc-1-phosphate transferase